MSADLPKTTIKFVTALLKHQAKFWLGEETMGIAAETFIDEDLQKRLDDWLTSDETAKKLLKASEQAHAYLQDPHNCPDIELRRVFHDMTFGDLPSIQAALTDLPDAMDSGKLEGLLFESVTRDIPNLKPEQHKEGARLYTDALLRAVGSLEQFVSPILLQTVLDLKKGQHGQEKKLDTIIALLQAKVNAIPASSPTLPGDLPIGSYLPFPRNGHFTGRSSDLEKLADALLGDHQTGVVVNQVITGIGGIGKTQLAVEFAYQYGHRFQGVHWLDLHEAGALETQIALCGSKMGLPLWPPTLLEQVTATMREWLQNSPRLLILDNFEEIESVNEVLARLRHSGLRLLITSRRTDWNTALGLKRLPLDEFSPGKSIEFLRNYISVERESDDEILKLAEHLGQLPLALELAGRYLKIKSRLKINEYLAELEQALENPSMQKQTVADINMGQYTAINKLDTIIANLESRKKFLGPSTKKLKVFLCYASEDYDGVIKIYERLIGDGIDAWIDKVKLIPGQKWKIEIEIAVKNAHAVIVFLSKNSISKEGFIQKEIKIALDVAEEKPSEIIYIIPARMEMCNVPYQLGDFQWVDLFNKYGYERLLESLYFRAKQLGL